MSSFTSRLTTLMSLVLLLSAASLSSGAPTETNHELLTSLGMVRRRLTNNHKKRVASESRSAAAASAEESHMFVIKLPPNPYYYAHLKPMKATPGGGGGGVGGGGGGGGGGSANDVNKVPVHFRSNGKPAKVYHWNLPALRRLAHGTRLKSGGGHVVHVHKAPPVHHKRKHAKPAKPAKGYSENDVKPRVSYYIPARKTFFHKYFPGNGKPHTLYVIDKDKKSAHYHRLLP